MEWYSFNPVFANSNPNAQNVVFGGYNLVSREVVDTEHVVMKSHLRTFFIIMLESYLKVLI